MLYPTLVDFFGINAFTARVLENAGRAIAAMRYVPAKHGCERKIVAITAFGVTTPAATQCVARLAEAGADAIVFPANGAGGRKMEQLIAAGEFDAVLDLTTTELADELMGGTASAGPDRLKAASRRSIPQVIAPGAIDMVNFGPPASVPDQFRGRQFYSHTPYTTLMRTTPAESANIGRVTAERLAITRAGSRALASQRRVRLRPRGWRLSRCRCRWGMAPRQLRTISGQRSLSASWTVTSTTPNLPRPP